MHLVDKIPLFISHVGKGLVAEDTGIVDEHINTAVCVNRGLDDCLSINNIGLVANSLSTKLLDLLHNCIWVNKIIDNNLGSELSEEQGVCATKTDNH